MIRHGSATVAYIDGTKGRRRTLSYYKKIYAKYIFYIQINRDTKILPQEEGGDFNKDIRRF